MIERDRKTLSELDEAKRLFEEMGLSGEAAEANGVRTDLERQQGSREFFTLYQIGQVINSILDLDRLLERIMDLAIETLDAERGLVILIDETSGEHRVVTARNVEKETSEDAARYSESVVRAAAHGQAVLSTDAKQDERFREFRSLSLYDIKSFMCVPLRVRERMIGTVYVDSRRIGNLFDDNDLRFLEAFANQAALAIENARLMRRLSEENRLLREAVSRQYGFDAVIGRSPAMERMLKTLAKVAPGSSPVLLLGESGSGKELLAKAIHLNSTVREGPLVALNCAAIPRELLESELFGHARGAFSGADREKKGLMEMADGGTLFFDEIGDMDVQLQAKLLRAVEEGAIRRVGETRLRPIAVRIVSATHHNLKEEVAAGRFREDLFYRLNVVSVRVPPLRERREDIVLLAQHFLRRAGERAGREIEGFDRAALDRLLLHSWPGNVRELENVVERAVAMADGARITVDDLPDELRPPVTSDGEAQAPTLPEGASSEERAQLLWDALTRQGKGFWGVVREPFLKRELSREDLRRLIERGLQETGGSYKKLAARFGVGDQYKKFHAFLKNSGGHLPRGRFVASSDEDE